MNVPVSVMATAGEGGPWGMAILAAYMKNKQGKTLADYLSENVFANAACSTVDPDPAEAEGFRAFMERTKPALPSKGRP